MVRNSGIVVNNVKRKIQMHLNYINININI